jgi:uncharacterized membrane protein YjfL (UPF0719 family)
MNTSLFAISIAQIVISIILLIFIIYIVLRFISFWLWKESKIQYSNQAFAIFNSGVVLAFGQMIVAAMNPIQNALHLLNNSNSSFYEKAKYVFFFILVVITIGILSIFTIVYLFDFLTKSIKETEELKKNNLSVAILLSVIIFTVAMIIKEPISGLLESLIPYPQIPNFR